MRALCSQGQGFLSVAQFSVVWNQSWWGRETPKEGCDMVSLHLQHTHTHTHTRSLQWREICHVRLYTQPLGGLRQISISASEDVKNWRLEVLELA